MITGPREGSSGECPKKASGIVFDQIPRLSTNLSLATLQNMRCNSGYKLGIQTITLTDVSKELHIFLNPKSILQLSSTFKFKKKIY